MSRQSSQPKLKKKKKGRLRRSAFLIDLILALTLRLLVLWLLCLAMWLGVQLLKAIVRSFNLCSV